MGQQIGSSSSINGNNNSSSSVRNPSIRNRNRSNGDCKNVGESDSSSSSTSLPRGVRFQHGTLFLDGSDNDGGRGGWSSSNGLDSDATTITDNVVSWLIDVFYGLLAFQCFLGLMTVVVFLYLIVRPFSVTVYRRLVNQIGLGSYVEAVGLLLPSTRICLTGDSDVPSPVGTSILVSNHVMDADWYSILVLGRCVGLRGSVKVFLRNEYLHLNKGTSSTTTSPRASSSTWNTSGSTNGTSTNNVNNNNNNNSSGSNGKSASQQLNQISGIWNITKRQNTANGSLTSGGGAAPNALSTMMSASASITTQQQQQQQQQQQEPTSIDLRLVAAFLRSFMEFPLIDEEDYVSDRESLFELLRSFADRNGASAPVHFLLYPEGWSLYNGENRNSVMARSNEFARREGRPQLKHLLLPRTTGFNASISCLRESNPVVYDMTVAYRGYDGSIPPKGDLSVFALWNLLRRQYPTEIHIRMKRYSMEEVLQDASWLDKQWAEKDRLLDYFARHNTFPVDRRGFCRLRVFESRMQSMETSIVSLVRLLLLPCAVPVLLFLSIPILWTTFWAWLFYRGYQYVMDVETTTTASPAATARDDHDGPAHGTSSQGGTPFTPATPFASPSISTWFR